MRESLPSTSFSSELPGPWLISPSSLTGSNEGEATATAGANCYCAILVHLTRRCTQWLQIWDFVALLACVAPTVLEFYFSIRYPALPRWARCVPRLRRWFVCRACLIPSLDEPAWKHECEMGVA